jgi:trans-aconitate 3-methyltransferase
VPCQCYSEFRLTKYPSLTHEIDEYSTVPTRNLGQYWERPGRNILQDHLQSVRFPTQPSWDASSGQRVYYVGNHYSTTGPNPAIRLTPGADEEVREVILRKIMTWEALENYLRTWSALHTFHAKHPEDRDHADGDIVQRFMRRLKDGVTDEVKSPSDQVEVEFPLALIMIKKAL